MQGKIALVKLLFVVALIELLASGGPHGLESAWASKVDLSDGLPGCQRESTSELFVSPFFGDDGTLFLNDYTNQPQVLWRSSDGGNRWQVALRPTDWYDHAAIRQRQVSIAPIREPSGLIVYARAAFWYTDGTTYALLKSTDSGETWRIYQMCDDSLAYCRNWGAYQATGDPSVWFVPRAETYTNVEADIQRWDGDPWFPELTTVWSETGALDLSISPEYLTDHLLFASLAPSSPSLHTALIKSSDGGDTWRDGTAGGLCQGTTAKIRFSPTFAVDRTVFALQNGAIFQSVDGGDTWRRVYPPGSSACDVPQPLDAAVDLQLSPHYSSDSTLYMFTRSTNPDETYLHVSTDGGLSWQVLLRASGFLKDLTVAANPLSVHQAEPFSRDVQPVMAPPLASSPSNDPAAVKVFFPLAAARGPEPRPLSIFLTRFPFHYRSDDGGVTWRCLALPPGGG